MKNSLSKTLVASLSAIAALSAASSAFADTITKWDFNVTGVHSAPYNTPAPTTGSGTAVTLGMNNAYNGGNTPNADVNVTTGTANNLFTENTWRVRGTAHNGWATHAAGAPQFSQGAEFDASTAGFSNIAFSFDWYSTTSGIRDLQVQYNTDTGNAAGWTNIGGTSSTGTYIAMSNDYYNAPGSPVISVDLSGVPGANNDPNLGIRLVSAFDSTGNIPNDFASAQLGTDGKTIIYNNSSGNWRFDNVTFSGSQAPEPASLGVLGMGTLALIARRRK